MDASISYSLSESMYFGSVIFVPIVGTLTGARYEVMKERKVNALASGADEGRSSLR